MAARLVIPLRHLPRRAANSSRTASCPYYSSQPVFSVKNLNGLLIEGNGAAVRLKGGWHFGSFDPATGEPFTPPRGRFTDRRYRAGDVTLFNIGGSSNVVVRNLELDGNVSSMVLERHG